MSNHDQLLTLWVTKPMKDAVKDAVRTSTTISNTSEFIRQAIQQKLDSMIEQDIMKRPVTVKQLN